MKLVVIGGGSYVFAPTILFDVIVKYRLMDCELALVDVNPEALHAMAGLARTMANELMVGVHTTITTDIRSALPGADFVILCASVEGAKRWLMDFDILSRHGLQDQARECGGLGGMIYSFRSISLLVDVCRDMEELCPSATLLDVTNPMPRLITAAHRYSSINAVGFCNMAWGGAQGYEWFGRLVGVEPSTLEIVTAGLNHFAWLASIRDRKTGDDLLPTVERMIRQGSSREFHVMRRWLDQYGGIIAGHVDHHAEYLPTQEDIHYHSKPPFHGDATKRNRWMSTLNDILQGTRNWEEIMTNPSWEHPVDLAVAIYKKASIDFDIVNVPNHGYLPQLPDGRVVEVPVRTRFGDIVGHSSVRLPENVAQLCCTISDVHELVAEASVTGDINVAMEAIKLDPAVGDKNVAYTVLTELIEAHRDVLPQFFRDPR